MTLQVDPGIAHGDTAWMLTAAALVMFMTPGLGYFYAGFTRSKNALATIMQSFIVVALVGVLWVIVGYTLAFGPTEGGIIGGLDFFGFKDVGIDPATVPVVTNIVDGEPVDVTWTPTIPHEAFAIFQAMFAIITPALITGAFAERAKFSTFLIFMAAWSLLVYAPVAHWIFGAGWLGITDSGGINALDFAGGAAIHVNAGAAALAAAFFCRRALRRFGADYRNCQSSVTRASRWRFNLFAFRATHLEAGLSAECASSITRRRR